MIITAEQVLQMAPDGSSAAAGKKLMAIKHWPELGLCPAALWGRCQGSAVYQVKVDLANLGYHCTCPSRKFPCKHVLGLLLLFAESPAAVSERDAPEWVDVWLQKRKDRTEKQAERTAERETKPVDEKAQQRRAEQRESRVSEGLERLDLWLQDLVRTGIAGLEGRPPSFWDEQAKRLVDAQAPGVASRVTALAGLPRSTPDWPARLLAEFGRLKLLIHAWRRIDQLAPPLQADVRQTIGWTVGKDELEQSTERVEDAWVVVGQWVDDDDRLRVQRSWLVGRESGQTALILQFAAGAQAFAESYLPGTEQAGTVTFYPGAARQRAKFASRDGTVNHVAVRVPGAERLNDFLARVSAQLAAQPWLSTFGGVLRDVTLVQRESEWLARDREGNALPLSRRSHWKLLAVTGGHPCDLAVEWDGRWLRPLGLFLEGRYRTA